MCHWWRQVIKYKPMLLQPIKSQYSDQIKLLLYNQVNNVLIWYIIIFNLGYGIIMQNAYTENCGNIRLDMWNSFATCNKKQNLSKFDNVNSLYTFHPNKFRRQPSQLAIDIFCEWLHAIYYGYLVLTCLYHNRQK